MRLLVRLTEETILEYLVMDFRDLFSSSFNVSLRDGPRCARNVLAPAFSAPLNGTKSWNFISFFWTPIYWLFSKLMLAGTVRALCCWRFSHPDQLPFPKGKFLYITRYSRRRRRRAQNQQARRQAGRSKSHSRRGQADPFRLAS